MGLIVSLGLIGCWAVFVGGAFLLESGIKGGKVEAIIAGGLYIVGGLIGIATIVKERRKK